MVDTINPAQAGSYVEFDGQDNTAARVASEAASGDPGSDRVQSARSSVGLRPNVANVRSADENIGSLVDVFA